MLSKYWRSFPWYIQFLQFFVLMVVLFSFFALALVPLALNLMHVNGDELVKMNQDSPIRVINAALLVQFISALGIFLLPALLFAYFTHPRPAKYLGLTRPANAIHFILPAVILLAMSPLLINLSGWISQIVNLGESFQKTQADNDRMMKAFLNLKSPLQLISTFIVLAVLPGFSEELFFRGLIMRFSAKRTYNVFIPLIVSALVFALFHSNVHGWLSIFIAGFTLASFYYLTGSLWPGIIAHMVFNGTQILLSYPFKSDYLQKIIAGNSLPFSWVVVGSVIAAGAFYLLWKTRTPLKPYWTSDYDPEEIMEGTE